jgi:hypothetical protein
MWTGCWLMDDQKTSRSIKTRFWLLASTILIKRTSTHIRSSFAHPYIENNTHFQACPHYKSWGACSLTSQHTEKSWRRSIIIQHLLSHRFIAMRELLLENALVSQEVCLNLYTISLALCSSLKHWVVDNRSHSNREHYYEPFFVAIYVLLLWVLESARNNRMDNTLCVDRNHQQSDL